MKCSFLGMSRNGGWGPIKGPPMPPTPTPSPAGPEPAQKVRLGRRGFQTQTPCCIPAQELKGEPQRSSSARPAGAGDSGNGHSMEGVAGPKLRPSLPSLAWPPLLSHVLQPHWQAPLLLPGPKNVLDQDSVQALQCAQIQCRDQDPQDWSPPLVFWHF